MVISIKPSPAPRFLGEAMLINKRNSPGARLYNMVKKSAPRYILSTSPIMENAIHNNRLISLRRISVKVHMARNSINKIISVIFIKINPRLSKIN